MLQNGCFYVQFFNFMYAKHCFKGIYMLFEVCCFGNPVRLGFGDFMGMTCAGFVYKRLINNVFVFMLKKNSFLKLKMV